MDLKKKLSIGKAKLSGSKEVYARRVNTSNIEFYKVYKKKMFLFGLGTMLDRASCSLNDSRRTFWLKGVTIVHAPRWLTTAPRCLI